MINILYTKKTIRIKSIIMISILGIALMLCIQWSYIELHTKTLLIVGDSIGEGTGSSAPELKWYRKLENYFREEYKLRLEVDNISMGGNTSFAGYVSTMLHKGRETYDYVIICYGENDKKENFSFYYEMLIRGIKEKYPKAKIISILESSQREYTNKIKDIQKLCQHYGIEMADTIKAFNESNYLYEELTDDGTHPNDRGYEVYYEKVKYLMKKLMDDNRNEEGGPISPYNKELNCYTVLAYYPFEKFERISELDYRIEVEEGEGILGIDYITVPGESIMEISLDKNETLKRHIIWENKFILQYIEVLSENVNLGSEITISFTSNEQVDNFNGVLFLKKLIK